MYVVINFFTDLQDNNYPYNVGDIFPRLGVQVSNKRLEELSGSDNKQKKPMIKFIEIPEVEKPKKAPVKRGTKKAADK